MGRRNFDRRRVRTVERDELAVGNQQTHRSALLDQYRRQLTKVLTRYGETFEVWFDGSNIVPVSDLLQKHAARAMVFQGPDATIRWVGNESGVAPYPAWNSLPLKEAESGVATARHGDPNGDAWLPNECDARIQDPLPLPEISRPDPHPQAGSVLSCRLESQSPDRRTVRHVRLTASRRRLCLPAVATQSPAACRQETLVSVVMARPCGDGILVSP